MHLTVDQALSIYPLSEGRLIAGGNGGSRIVKSVNVMDAPDISDWIKQGELLLTTAYIMKDDPGHGEQLLHRLNKRAAAGLGIKLGRFWTSIPQPLIDLANKLGFPVIELPYQFTLSDQINGLFRAELQRSTNGLQLVMEKQRRLMRFALQSNSIHQLFSEVSEALGYPVAIVGSKGQVLYNATTYDEAMLKQAGPGLARPQWVRIQGSQAYRVPLASEGSNAGYVLFFSESAVQSPVEEGLFCQAAEVLSYHMNFNEMIYYERSLHKDFGMLIKQYLKNAVPLNLLKEYIAKLEIDVFDGAYRTVLVDVGGVVEEENRRCRLEQLREGFMTHSALAGKAGMHVLLEEGLLLFYPDQEGRTEAELVDMIIACMNGITFRRGEIPKAAMEGRCFGVAQLTPSYMEVKRTLRTAFEWGIEETVVTCRELELVYLFERVPEERVRRFCNKTIGKLLANETESGQELLRTLEAFMESDGQIAETAKRLFIHRNTVTYRMERLSELLEVDFKRYDDLLRLRLALMFKRSAAKGSEAAEDGVQDGLRLRRQEG